MILPELLAPAGSFESVRAAVQNGASAVYMGFGSFNARRGAKNFTRSEMADAIAYCRARNVKTNITLNILVSDRERADALQDAKFLYEAGADALILQDLGLARLLRRCAPSLALHASTQMTVSTLDGAILAKELGFSRVVLARETPLSEIRRITEKSGVETEIFIHGALCRCYSGQCFLSSVIGRRSGNRGLCAQPCRLPYRYDGKGRETYPLSLKDLSLARHIPTICSAGVASLKIEGRMKRPEYTAIVTRIYAALIREQRAPTPAEEDALRRVFSRDGFTDGYFTGQQGDAMFGIKTELPLSEVQGLYDEAARSFSPDREAPLVPVDFRLTASGGQPLTLTADDGCHTVSVSGSAPEPARNRATSDEQIEKALRKTGGTPFFLRRLSLESEDGLAVPASALNALRREALFRLTALREQPPRRELWQMPPADPACTGSPPHSKGCPGTVLEARSFAQITPALLETAPAAVYLPLTELFEHLEHTRQLARQLPVAAVLPRVFFDAERDNILHMLDAVRQAGIHTALAGNLGQIRLLREQGMTVYGDFGLNAFQSDTLAALAELGVERQALSFELRLEQARDLRSPIQTELLAYGYLPLMVFELCAIRRKADRCTCKNGLTHLTDRIGHAFPLLPEYGCRNTLLNSVPLAFLPPASAGINFLRLRFTIEPPEECARVAKSYFQKQLPAFAGGSTRGLYRRGVE